MTGETRDPREGQIEVPLLRLLNVECETGGIAVEVLGAGAIKGEKQQGLESAGAGDLGDAVAGRQSASPVAFRFRAGDSAARSLSGSVARYSQPAALSGNNRE